MEVSLNTYKKGNQWLTYAVTERANEIIDSNIEGIVDGIISNGTVSIKGNGYTIDTLLLGKDYTSYGEGPYEMHYIHEIIFLHLEHKGVSSVYELVATSKLHGYDDDYVDYNNADIESNELEDIAMLGYMHNEGKLPTRAYISILERLTSNEEYTF